MQEIIHNWVKIHILKNIIIYVDATIVCDNQSSPYVTNMNYESSIIVLIIFSFNFTKCDEDIISDIELAPKKVMGELRYFPSKVKPKAEITRDNIELYAST